MGRNKIVLSKEQILAAQAVTQSNLQAARRLRVDYRIYKRWAKHYIDFETGKTLFEKHLATSKGIPRFKARKLKDIPIEEVIEGRVDGKLYPVNEIRDKLISDQILHEKCSSCGYEERRIKDYKMPLLLTFKDSNKKNFLLDNLTMLCYNCYFLQMGDIFTSKDLDHIEGHIPLEETSEVADFEVDDYMLKRFRELGIAEEEDDDPDGLNEIIARK